MRLEVHHRLVNFLLGIEDEWSVLDDFLIEGKTGYKNCDLLVYEFRSFGQQNCAEKETIQGG